MDEKVLHFIEAEGLIEQGSTCLVGVSGGPDSLALLHLLWSNKEKLGINLIAISVDHMLRGEGSAADVRYVGEVCEAWGIACVQVKVDVNEYKLTHKVSTQVAARVLRYEAFREQMERLSADYLVLGHHGDDQAETMIMSLARTTNLNGMAGIPMMREFHGKTIVRPLLSVSRMEIEHYCAEKGLQARMDPSNQDTSYTRNNVRANIIPHLKAKNHNLHITMQSLSASLQADEKFIMEAAQKAAQELIFFEGHQKEITFSIKSFNSLSVSLQRRIYRLILNYLYDEIPGHLSHVHERIFSNLFCAEGTNKVIDFPNNLKLERTYDQAKMYFAASEGMAEPFHILIDEVPSSLVLPNGRVLQVSYTEKEADRRPNTYIFAKGQVAFPLHVRNRQPGDRMTWEGLHGSKKLKNLLIDEKVPRELRDELYVVADNEAEIMWVITMKKGKLKRRAAEGPNILLEYN